MKNIKTYTIALAVMLSAATTSHAIVGAGFHWGFDFSMSMDNARNEGVSGISGLPSASSIPNIGDLVGDADFLRISRENWDRSAINFGGKVYIDFIPVIPIDAIELSLNFGLWQYDGVLEYMSGVNGEGLPEYTRINLGLDDVGIGGYFGMGGLPYAKLHFDATLRRQLLNLAVIKFDAGLGYSLHLATPLLSAGLVEDVLGANIDDIHDNLASGGDMARQITQYIRDNTLDNAVHGAHILLGVRAKLPVMPIGFYIDTKFMMPFTKFDAEVGSGISGWGILLNTGISLSI